MNIGEFFVFLLLFSNFNPEVKKGNLSYSKFNFGKSIVELNSLEKNDNFYVNSFNGNYNYRFFDKHLLD